MKEETLFRAICSITDCMRTVYVRGLCNMHYLRLRRLGPLPPLPPRPSVSDRFWANVQQTTGCWPWTGATSRGYGKILDHGQMKSVHRVSWELTYGSIPDGLGVLHRCDNPPCVRPEHLFLGTATDNNRDRDVKGRNGFSRKTHCPQGHPYDGNNLYLWRGGRKCRECWRVRNRARLVLRRCVISTATALLAEVQKAVH